MIVYFLADGCIVAETNRRTLKEFAETLKGAIAEHGEVVDIQWT